MGDSQMIGGRNPGDVATAPEYWSKTTEGSGGTLLTYAVRGGGKQLAVTLLGGVLVIGGAWSLWRFVAGGDLTGAGFIFLLIPAGAILMGVYCLDITLRAQSSYLLGKESLRFRRSSLFGNKTQAIPRQSITKVSHRYSPPRKNSAQGAAGDWITAVEFRDGGGADREIVLDGMRTREEARWLGPLLGTWAGVPLQRGFAGGFEEADPGELPGS